MKVKCIKKKYRKYVETFLFKKKLDKMKEFSKMTDDEIVDTLSKFTILKEEYIRSTPYIVDGYMAPIGKIEYYYSIDECDQLLIISTKDIKNFIRDKKLTEILK